MKVSYESGPREVEIAQTGQRVKRGEVVEVGDSIGRQLVAQGWEQHGAKPAATKASDKEKE